MRRHSCILLKLAVKTCSLVKALLEIFPYKISGLSFPKHTRIMLGRTGNRVSLLWGTWARCQRQGPRPLGSLGDEAESHHTLSLWRVWHMEVLGLGPRPESSDPGERSSKSTRVHKWKPFFFAHYRLTTTTKKGVFPFKESWVECIPFNEILQKKKRKKKVKIPVVGIGHWFPVTQPFYKS